MIKILHEKNYTGDTNIIINCTDPDNQLIELLKYIKDNSAGGHSFPVVVDTGIDKEKSFYIDGDGTFKIYDIKLKED